MLIKKLNVTKPFTLTKINFSIGIFILPLEEAKHDNSECGKKVKGLNTIPINSWEETIIRKVFILNWKDFEH